MIESVSIPKTAQADPVQKITPWETFWRCLVLLLGIFLGLIAAFVIAAAVGWLRIGC